MTRPTASTAISQTFSATTRLGIGMDIFAESEPLTPGFFALPELQGRARLVAVANISYATISVYLYRPFVSITRRSPQIVGEFTVAARPAAWTNRLFALDECQQTTQLQPEDSQPASWLLDSSFAVRMSRMLGIFGNWWLRHGRSTRTRCTVICCYAGISQKPVWWHIGILNLSPLWWHIGVLDAPIAFLSGRSA